jgi:hypothetical protein
MRRALIAVLTFLIGFPLAHAAFAQIEAEPTSTDSHALDVTVLDAGDPSGALAIEVGEDLSFDPIAAGGNAAQDVWMRIINDTTGSWQVTVDGDDLWSFEFGEPCDDTGCTRVPAGDETIPKSAITVHGGDHPWGGDDDAVVPCSGSLGTTPVVIATGHITGDIQLEDPMTGVELTIPVDARPGDYTTALTYTIMVLDPPAEP